MALLTEREVRARANELAKSRRKSGLEVLSETASMDATFDVFLSHSSMEPEEILTGIKGFLEDEGLSVYVDKYTDPQLSPGKVTRKTANILRNRLRSSRSLLYIHSDYSGSSRWMPWELGFMDGAKKRVGIVPVVQVARDTFEGQEYLGLYPYLDRAGIEGCVGEILWINNPTQEYRQFKQWLHGTEAFG